jgi:methyl-accepting chemotaxis protein
LAAFAIVAAMKTNGLYNASLTGSETNAGGGRFLRFSEWTIGRRISVGFALLVLVAGALGVFSLTKNTALEGRFSEVSDDSLPSLELISSVNTSATLNRLAIYKHISSNSADDMAALEAQIQQNSKNISEKLGRYDELSKSALERQLVNAIQTARKDYLKKVNEVLERSRAGGNAAAVYLFARAELDPIALKYADALGAASEYEKAHAADLASAFRRDVEATRRGVAAGLAVALGLGILIAWMIVRSTNRVLVSVSSSLEDGAVQVASSSKQVSAASQMLAEGASEQAASLEETGSSLEEMSGMTRRNSESARKANDLARQARSAADHGAADMAAMKSAMGDIKASSEDIAKIIKTIDEIAFQTNILALNAAVEAARAGSAGAGFAVVAEEVRGLAQRSAQAARETAEKIDDARNKSAQGFVISEKVALSLSEIVEKVRQVDQLIAEVSTASDEQSQGVTQINSAVSQMDKVVQSSASSAEETASAAEELNGQAVMMRNSVERLQALVGGSAAGSHIDTAPAENRRLSFGNSSAAQVNRMPSKAPRVLSNIPSSRSHGGEKLSFKDFN